MSRGVLSLLAGLVFPFGRFCRSRWCDPDCLARGYVLILPGIEGKSFFNIDIARGLLDAGVPYAIEVFDWTTGWTVLALRHLRSRARHVAQATEVARKIVEYSREHPEQPIYIVGHSGGEGIALMALELLPEGCRIEKGILFAPAVSPEYDVTRALESTRGGIINFSSKGDLLFLGLGTWIFGTIDRRHCAAAGFGGFQSARIPLGSEPAGPSGQLEERPYSLQMMRMFHFGGHFGWTNRKFVAEVVAPLL